MDEIRNRARRAYELARLRAALPWAIPAILFGLGSAWLGVGLAVVLAAAVVGFKWLGRDYGRAVLPGLAVGLLGFAAPTGWELWNAGCCAGSSCASECMAVCASGGVLGGLVLFRHVRRSAVGRTGTLAALAVASLATGIGCLQIGAMGMIGVAGLWAITAPALFATPQPQS